MSNHDDEQVPIAIPFEQLKSMATAVADELRNAGGDAPASSGGGSAQRNLPEDLRSRFITVRAALFQRGIYDPVLVRFDTASAPQASNAEIAEQLATVAETLTPPRTP
ncbi:MAG TPA: hypothetical protein VGF48_02140 [Thermoanaerobaculia bacterium]